MSKNSILLKGVRNKLNFTQRRGENMIPNDPAILLSYVNTKLRDEYASLDIMCDDLQLNRAELEQKLEAIDYKYDEALNKFL